MDLVKSIGADKVVDYTKYDFTKNGETYDIIFDLTGNISFSNCKNSLKQNGKFLQAAIKLKVFPSVLMTSIFSTKKSLIIATGLRPPIERSKDLKFITELFESGKIKAVIDKIFLLEEITEAHRNVGEGHKKGNVIVKME